MRPLLNRTLLGERLAATFASPQEIAKMLPLRVELPPDLKLWLTRLMLLYGVPFNSLAPDEGMLPPESIRFFYLDMSWIDALVDGAFSIGRNLASTSDGTPSLNVDRAVHVEMRAQVRANQGAIRASMLGIRTAGINSQVVTGFVLRSSLVTAYPGLGVRAYAKGSETPLTILRMEALGPQSDTMICLFDGEANQVDIHEPPEALHFGIDSYRVEDNQVKAFKKVYKFSISDGKIVIPGTSEQVTLDSSFRTSSPRTLMMTTVAQQIAAVSSQPSIDSAEMGFEMTEGVGMVSFEKA